MRTLSLQRAEILLMHFLKSHKQPSGVLEVLSTAEVALQERFITKYKSIFAISLNLEPSFDLFMRNCQSSLTNSSIIRNILANEDFTSRERYVLALTHGTGASVSLWFDKDATSEDIFKGFLHACILREAIAARATFDGIVEVCKNTRGTDAMEIRMAHTLACQLLPGIWERMTRLGWSLDTMVFAAKGALYIYILYIYYIYILYIYIYIYVYIYIYIYIIYYIYILYIDTSSASAIKLYSRVSGCCGFERNSLT